MASQGSLLLKNRTNSIFSLVLPPKLSREMLGSLLALFHLLLVWERGRAKRLASLPARRGKGKPGGAKELERVLPLVWGPSASGCPPIPGVAPQPCTGGMGERETERKELCGAEGKPTESLD